MISIDISFSISDENCRNFKDKYYNLKNNKNLENESLILPSKFKIVYDL